MCRQRTAFLRSAAIAAAAPIAVPTPLVLAPAAVAAAAPAIRLKLVGRQGRRQRAKGKRHA